MARTIIAPFVRRWGRGSGPRVLLIHGLSAYSGSWWRIASRLASNGSTVDAPDLRGHGHSPATESYAFDEMVADLAGLGGGWDLIVGHSLGGPIAAMLAAGPGQCRGLLLLDPFLDVADAAFDDLVDEQLAEVDSNATTESVASAFPAWHSEDCFHKAISARLTSPHVVERCLRDNAPYHHLGLVGQVEVPTQILGSDPSLDALFTPDSMGQIGNPDVSYRLVAGAGHSLQRERPDIVTDAAMGLLPTA